jgi:hypothetical protein
MRLGFDDDDAFRHLIERYSEKVVARLHLIKAGLKVSQCLWAQGIGSESHGSECRLF